MHGDLLRIKPQIKRGISLILVLILHLIGIKRVLVSRAGAGRRARARARQGRAGIWQIQVQGLGRVRAWLRLGLTQGQGLVRAVCGAGRAVVDVVEGDAGVGELCPVTGEVLLPGEVVSPSACARLVVAVRSLPELMAEVEHALAGLRSGMGSAGGSGYSSRALINLGLWEAVEEMRDSLVVWADALAQWARPGLRLRPGDWIATRAVFERFAGDCTRWPEAAAMVDEVLYAVRRLEHLASPRSRQSTYRGPCPACGLPVWSVGDAQPVECECGQSHDVTVVTRAAFESLLDQWLPRDLAVAVAEFYLARSIPAGTVRSWISRGALVQAEHDALKFRAGDVVALVQGAARRV